MEWVREVCANSEHGEQNWADFQAAVTAQAGPDVAPRVAASKASMLRAQAEAKVGDEGSQFLSFMGTKVG